MPDTPVISYVDTQAWKDKLEQWGPGYADLVKASIVSEIGRGAGPVAVASKMRQLAPAIPKAAAENLTRTLQLTSYRDQCLEMELQNDEFIEGKIRIAKLDDKTCLACIGLHGTPLALGQRVDDHYSGRCTEFYIVPGGDRVPRLMQADSTPGNRRFIPFQTGEEWFASLPEERQLQQASFLRTPSKFNVYKATGGKLDIFVGDHEDEVFGHQIVEKSIKGAIGEEEAKGFYIRTNRMNVGGGPESDDEFFEDEDFGEGDDGGEFENASSTKAQINKAKKKADAGLSFVFEDFDDMQERFAELGDTWGEKLTPEEAQAVLDYTSSDFYENVNGALRGSEDIEVTDKVLADIELLKGALEKAGTLPEDMTLYREFEYQDFIDSLRSGETGIGDTFTEKGFMSTTAMSDTLSDGEGSSIHLVIVAPEGTPAAWLGQVEGGENLDHELQGEFLLPPGTDLKILAIEDKGENAPITVYVEIIKK